MLALRLPFLNQAIQGDDLYYLYGAEHAQVEPLHPTHVQYAFLGQMVDMRGHPHPPFDSWFLGGLLAWFGTVSEVPFHAAYIVFSLIAAWSALAIARRFSPKPLLATLLFVAVPSFVINGNSLESDLPFVAFWLLSVALFLTAVDRRSLWLLLGASSAMFFAALTAFQSVVLAPILLLYVYWHAHQWRPAWIAACTAPLVIVVWQLWERVSNGALPATMLAGYMQTYGLQALAQKIRNAVALTGHLAWLVFPVLPVAALRPNWRWLFLIAPAVVAAALYDPSPLFWVSIGTGVLILVWCATHVKEFPAAWILIFFASALVIFFAGSARYLLPIALPLAILISARLSSRWLTVGFLAGLMLSLALAVVNYQHWNGYRQIALSLANQAQTHRVWVNAEWGLRFYLERDGALPLLHSEPPQPGDLIVSGDLGNPKPVHTGSSILTPIAARTITSAIPIRLVALTARSGYSTTLFGLRPFDISTAPIDRVRAEAVTRLQPNHELLTMNAPDAARQILSGVYNLENGKWRWIGHEAVLLLKTPEAAEPLHAAFYISQQAPARKISLAIDGKPVAQETYTQPGAYTLTIAPVQPSGPATTLTITVDKTFTVPGDPRELGVILTEAGFGPSHATK